jgi:hypothetical protein
MKALRASAMRPPQEVFFPLENVQFPTRAATISGELIAFYQIGYGVAAFGVGPLKELGGVDYSTAFSLGSLVSLLLGGVALAIVRRSNLRPG